MYELIRRLTAHQLMLEQLPLLLASLGLAEIFYKFHSFLLETSAFLLTWLAIGALHAAVRKLLVSGERSRS
jgi:uncharacterized membrane protein YoaK (UPF0700 family)